jgi:hypothetical protein
MSCQQLSISLGGHRQKELRFLDWLLLHSCSLSQSTPDEGGRKDGMRERREFNAQREFEMSAALTVSSWPQISDSKIAAPTEKLHRVIIWTGAASISFEQFKNGHHNGTIYKALLKARRRAIQVPRYATIEYKQ